MQAYLRVLIVLLLSSLPAAGVAAEHETVARMDIEYAKHGGIRLAGDLYLPAGLTKAPVLVAVHGGGWQNGNRSAFSRLGPYLAKHGYGVFAISYRSAKRVSFPAKPMT